MIPKDRQVTLTSGEVLTAGELFEGLVLFARNDSVFPIMTQSDLAKAVIAVAFQAIEQEGEQA